MQDSSPANPTSPPWPSPIHLARGIGAALGAAVVAYFAVYFLKKNGFYTMMLPGLLIGMACGYLSGCKSPVMGVVALVVALIAGVLIEWHVYWDVTLPTFLSKFHTIGSTRLLMHGLGAAMAFWFGTGR